MKRIGFIFALCVALVFVSLQNARGEKVDTFQSLLDRNEPIKIFVNEIKNSAGNSKIDTADLRKRLEGAFSERRPNKFDFSGKTVQKAFEVVKQPAEADIILNSVVIECLFTEEDPIDLIGGAVSLAYDIATTTHYVRMQVVFSVNMVKNRVLLWENKVQATVDHATMTEEESYDIANERIIKVLMKELFKEPDTSL